MNYSVKEIAEKMGLTEHTIRYYTDQNLFPCKRDSNNRRVFDDQSVNWLQGIKCLRACGVSIEDIKIYCDLCLEGDVTIPERHQFMLHQQELAQERLREAQEVANYMDYKVKHYEEILANKIPDDMNPATKETPGVGKQVG
ncbi:MAG: MerR family transcriptional regulator [Lachnospiraceae bacterium]|nr:MerR family transcriptional regulator [Lachnospiraceae bacterium]